MKSLVEAVLERQRAELVAEATAPRPITFAKESFSATRLNVALKSERAAIRAIQKARKAVEYAKAKQDMRLEVLSKLSALRTQYAATAKAIARLERRLNSI